MKKILTLIIVVSCLTSCGISTQLYDWGGSLSTTTTYENLTYRHYHQQSPESICGLLCMYEEMINNPGGSRQVPPPGICAEYGYLLLKKENADIFAAHATESQKKTFEFTDYASHFPEKGKKLLQMEIELYPESAKFITPLIDRLCK